MGAADFNHTPNEAELAFVRKTYEQSSAFLCICGGMFPPLQAGLLKGKTATAPRSLIPKFSHDHSETEWVERRWARDGKLWISGALLDGLDLMQAFVSEMWGGEGSLVGPLLEIGGWPVRDVVYE